MKNTVQRYDFVCLCQNNIVFNVSGLTMFNQKKLEVDALLLFFAGQHGSLMALELTVCVRHTWLLCWLRMAGFSARHPIFQSLSRLDATGNVRGPVVAAASPHAEFTSAIQLVVEVVLLQQRVAPLVESALAPVLCPE